MSGLIRCPNGHLFSSRRYGTVCPYCNIETATQERKETSMVGQSDVDVDEMLMLEKIDPVCGWLVCIDGPRQGKDYKIKSGKNFIGRADDMDIQILGDNRISRRNHAILVYDPKKHEAAVYTPVVLSVYDVIEMGESKFLFVPFCGDHFRWEDPSGLPEEGGYETEGESDGSYGNV